jgi:hypothetical protein
MLKTNHFSSYCLYSTLQLFLQMADFCIITKILNLSRSLVGKKREGSDFNPSTSPDKPLWNFNFCAASPVHIHANAALHNISPSCSHLYAFPSLIRIHIKIYVLSRLFNISFLLSLLPDSMSFPVLSYHIFYSVEFPSIASAAILRAKTKVHFFANILTFNIWINNYYFLLGFEGRLSIHLVHRTSSCHVQLTKVIFILKDSEQRNERSSDGLKRFYVSNTSGNPTQEMKFVKKYKKATAM